MKLDGGSWVIMDAQISIHDSESWMVDVECRLVLHIVYLVSRRSTEYRWFCGH